MWLLYCNKCPKIYRPREYSASYFKGDKRLLGEITPRTITQADIVPIFQEPGWCQNCGPVYCEKLYTTDLLEKLVEEAEYEMERIKSNPKLKPRAMEMMFRVYISKIEQAKALQKSLPNRKPVCIECGGSDCSAAREDSSEIKHEACGGNIYLGFDALVSEHVSCKHFVYSFEGEMLGYSENQNARYRVP